MWCLIFVIHT